MRGVLGGALARPAGFLGGGNLLTVAGTGLMRTSVFRRVRRVELAEAGSVEEALAAWRRAIERGEDTPAQAERVAELVWRALAAALPPDTDTV